MEFNSRGNPLAVVLVAMAVLAIVVVSMQQVQIVTGLNDSNASEKVRADISTITSASLRQSASEFMLGGYSGESKTWYANKFCPSQQEEIESNFSTFAKKNLSVMLSDLKAKKGYLINDGDISLSVTLPAGAKDFETFVNSLGDDSVSFNPNIKAAVTSQSVQKTVVYNDSTTLNYHMWSIYKGLANWGVNELLDSNTGGLRSEVALLMDNMAPCNVNRCSCYASDSNVFSDAELYGMIDQNKFKTNFLSLIKTKVEKLNTNYFDNLPISCTLKINYVDVNADISRTQVCIPASNNEPEKHLCGISSTRTSNSKNYIQLANITSNPAVLRNCFEGLGGSTVNFDSIPLHENDTFVSCKSGFVAKDERVVINPEVVARVTVHCEDKTNIIALEKEPQLLAAEIAIDIGMRKNCATQELAVDPTTEENSDPGCIPPSGGGSSGSGNGGAGIPCKLLPGVLFCNKIQVPILGNLVDRCDLATCDSNGDVNTIEINSSVCTNCKGGDLVGPIGPNECTLSQNNTGELGCAYCSCDATGHNCKIIARNYVCSDSDSNACTVPTCVKPTGNSNKYECKSIDKQCWQNNFPCSMSVCNSTTGYCENQQLVDCGDSNACTIDYCQSTYSNAGPIAVCQHTPLTCYSSSSDSQQCWKEKCVSNTNGTGGCTHTANDVVDCSSGYGPQYIVSCSLGNCIHAERCPLLDGLLYTDALCGMLNPTNPSTTCCTHTNIG